MIPLAVKQAAQTPIPTIIYYHLLLKVCLETVVWFQFSVQGGLHSGLPQNILE
jgi:hypothetical protein